MSARTETPAIPRDGAALRPALLCWVSLAVLLGAGAPVIAATRDSSILVARSIRVLPAAIALAVAPHGDSGAVGAPTPAVLASPLVWSPADASFAATREIVAGRETDLPPPGRA